MGVCVRVCVWVCVGVCGCVCMCVRLWCVCEWCGSCVWRDASGVHVRTWCVRERVV